MSQPAVSQLRSEQPVGGNSPQTTPNGIETPAASGGSTQNIPHFGTFNEEVRQGVKSLHKGLAIAEDAASELKKIFKKNEKIVSAVAERWEDDQALHEEIRKLRAANDGIWEHIDRDREIHARTISGLKQKHSEEVSRLEAQAMAGDREKQRYEESKRKMENKYKEDKENGDAALEQKKSQLEKDNADKIFTLEKDRRDLEKTKAGLEEQVKQLTKERDQEMQIHEAMQKTITDMTSKYKVDPMPWDY
jgi:chromosome segregation ATPase